MLCTLENACCERRVFPTFKPHVTVVEMLGNLTVLDSEAALDLPLFLSEGSKVVIRARISQQI
jgi:hypothetical protein